MLKLCCNDHSDQFGFVRDHETNKAIFAATVEATLKDFNGKGSGAFTCALDAEKTFAHINKYFLFYCLLFRGIFINVINVLISWYSKVELTVKWLGGLSKSFNVKSDILQESLISSKLFNIATNSLLSKLELSYLGCCKDSCNFSAIV